MLDPLLASHCWKWLLVYRMKPIQQPQMPRANPIIKLRSGRDVSLLSCVTKSQQESSYWLPFIFWDTVHFQEGHLMPLLGSALLPLLWHVPVFKSFFTSGFECVLWLVGWILEVIRYYHIQREHSWSLWNWKRKQLALGKTSLSLLLSYLCPLCAPLRNRVEQFWSLHFMGF